MKVKLNCKFFNPWKMLFLFFTKIINLKYLNKWGKDQTLESLFLGFLKEDLFYFFPNKFSRFLFFSIFIILFYSFSWTLLMCRPCFRVGRKLGNFWYGCAGLYLVSWYLGILVFWNLLPLHNNKSLLFFCCWVAENFSKSFCFNFLFKFFK